jgi:outer membrane protein assembly factor BamB
VYYLVLNCGFVDEFMSFLDEKNEFFRRYEVIMRKYYIFAAILLAGVSAAFGGDWPNWRGPYYNGSTDEKNLPSSFSQTEGIAWSVDLPGCSAATPIIKADKVFISGVDADRDMLLAMCFDCRSGKQLWQHDIAKGIGRDRRSTYAAGSPVTDGKIVVFFYGNGELVCFDVDGGRKWARNIQEDYGDFAFLWTFASSPALVDGRVYVQVLQRDVPVRSRGRSDKKIESYLLAVSPDTGKTLWRQVRPSKARAESFEAFSTPIPFTLSGKQQLLVVGGDALTGHDVETGKELWRWGTYNPRRVPHWRLVPSPVAGDGIVLACGPKNAPVYAIRPRGSGVLDDSAIAWVSEDVREVTSDVPTPAFYDGDFFVLSDLRKSLSRVEPKSGKVKWTIRTPGDSKYEASPLAADGKIYLINHSGDVAIIDAANGDVLRVIDMGKAGGREVVRASISAAYGQLFIRTTRKLYCVGKGR